MNIPGYRIEREIGSGGMATVYLAVQESLERPVALKVIHRHLSRDESFRQRFFNEARLMARLSHPSIVQAYDFAENDEGLYIVMECVRGRSLDHMIGAECGPIPHEKALPLFVQILEGIAYAHSRGVIHRDIKPSNVLVSQDGHAKITDLGIAKIAGQKGLTRTGAQMGTLYYESPEQIRGAKDVDHRADIYSLGMTLYEMLAGRLPFEGDGDTSEFQVMNSIVNRQEQLDPRDYYPHVPEWLVDIVQQATHLEVIGRFQDCTEMRDAILDSGRVSTSNGYWTGRVSSPVGSRSFEFPEGDLSGPHTGLEEHCPSCSATVEEDMEFCGKCGTDLRMDCPDCGRKIRRHNEFCPRCGVNIEKKLKQIEAKKEQKRKLEEEREREIEEKRLAKEKQRDEERRRQEEAILLWEGIQRKKQQHKERVLQRSKELESEEQERERELSCLRLERIRNMKVWLREHWLVLLSSTTLVVLGIYITLYISSDRYAYGKAVNLYESGRHAEAANAFQSLGDYRDSEDRWKSISYLRAESLYTIGDLEAAARVFETLGNYRDAPLYHLDCTLKESLGAEDIQANAGPLPGILFIPMPAGSYRMGSPSSEAGRDVDEGPVHTVHVDAFELMTTEVTQGMWEEVMGENPSDFAGADNRPVDSISWNDCKEFIARLNEMDPAHTYRLPSEAEWEYACRAGTTTSYYWGASDAERATGRYCWFYLNSGNTTQFVGTKEPNAWGLYDMSGNVSEWCEDSWHGDYNGAPRDGTAWVSDGASDRRVLRGGDWARDPRDCRSANRLYSSPGYRGNVMGLRLARSVP